MEKCPCCSKKNYMDCCGVFLGGDAKASTAEQLMRARYTAHVKHKIDYIVDTIHKTTRENNDRETIERWASQTSWTKLEIISTQGGSVNEEVGRVVFKAHYKLNDQLKFHSEDSGFKKEEGEWFYVDGTTPKTQPKRTLKVGRNDPCYCGSGKKFKKCCK